MEDIAKMFSLVPLWVYVFVAIPFAMILLKLLSKAKQGDDFVSGETILSLCYWGGVFATLGATTYWLSNAGYGAFLSLLGGILLALVFAIALRSLLRHP